MAHCPAYRGPICSLCCSLDARCHDLCKPQARAAVQWRAALQRLIPARAWRRLDTELGHYLMLMALLVPALAGLFVAIWRLESGGLVALAPAAEAALRLGFVKVFAVLLVAGAIVAWWLVLKHKSAQVAQEESNRQTHLLVQEIDSHRRTDEALQRARLSAEEARRQAEAANQAKSRYITAISHELRTPLNSILGYAQLLEEDESMPPNRRRAVGVIRRGGDHLLGLIEGTLDLARIENGRLALQVQPMLFRESVREIAHLFELQAAGKGIAFRHEVDGVLPDVVRADEKRLRQILINVLGNAVKFTLRGEVVFRVAHVREMARFEIVDSGPGMAPDELERVFEPFERGSAAGGTTIGGTGLGLTIARMLTDLMGGEMTVRSEPGVGTTFTIRLFLPETHGAAPPREAVGARRRSGYQGPRRSILLVDNEEVDRGLLVNLLEPLGFEMHQAASGEDGLRLLETLKPDAIFMDLAMPGIDGWETVRHIRARRLSEAPLAIVSANAFDKGLENDVGIAAADFLVKPVRLGELLDWLGERLGLTWIEPEPAAAAPPAGDNPPLVVPPAEALRSLREVVAIGYVRGVLKRLDEIEAATPAAAPYLASLREHARHFRFEALTSQLERSLNPVDDPASSAPAPTMPDAAPERSR